MSLEQQISELNAAYLLYDDVCYTQQTHPSRSNLNQTLIHQYRPHIYQYLMSIKSDTYQTIVTGKQIGRAHV